MISPILKTSVEQTLLVHLLNDIRANMSVSVNSTAINFYTVENDNAAYRYREQPVHVWLDRKYPVKINTLDWFGPVPGGFITVRTGNTEEDWSLFVFSGMNDPVRCEELRPQIAKAILVYIEDHRMGPIRELHKATKNSLLTPEMERLLKEKE